MWLSPRSQLQLGNEEKRLLFRSAVVTLRAVIRLEALHLLLIERSIASISAQRVPDPKSPLVGENARDWNFREYMQSLLILAERARAMGFVRTATKAEEFALLVRRMLSSDFPHYPEFVSQIRSAYDQDTRGLIISISEPDKAKYATGVFVLADVTRSFPTSARELAEAGSCLAYERNTACVFHALRSLEMPLKVIAKSVRIKLADDAKGKNWYHLLTQIEAALNQLPKVRKDEVQHTLSYLSNVRGPLRNATMHLDKSYNADEAKDILDTICIFFKYIPKHLGESRTRKPKPASPPPKPTPTVSAFSSSKQVIVPKSVAVTPLVKPAKAKATKRVVRLYTIDEVAAKYSLRRTKI